MIAWMRKGISEQEGGLRELINYIPKTDLVVIELGSYSGDSASIFMESGKVKTLYCVDSWANGYDVDDPASQSDMSGAEQMFDNVVAKHSGIIKVKKNIHEAVKDFELKSVDLVYIDACHLYDNVCSDIKDYLPIVKVGGFIAGHDYGFDRHPGVKMAVDEILGVPDMVFADRSWIKGVK